MKTIILLAFLLMAKNTFSETQTTFIKNENLDNILKISKPEFKIDQHNLGRAWVSLNILYSDIETDYTEILKLKISGLFHDLKTDEIKIKKKNKTVVCALIKRNERRFPLSHLTKKIKIEETKACKFSTSIVENKDITDTGFDLVEKNKKLLKFKITF